MIVQASKTGTNKRFETIHSLEKTEHLNSTVGTNYLQPYLSESFTASRFFLQKVLCHAKKQMVTSYPVHVPSNGLGAVAEV